MDEKKNKTSESGTSPSRGIATTASTQKMAPPTTGNA
jgi:hypothetical protein